MTTKAKTSKKTPKKSKTTKKVTPKKKLHPADPKNAYYSGKKAAKAKKEALAKATPKKVKITKADVKAAAEAVKAQYTKGPTPHQESVLHYLLSHRLAVIADLEGVSPVTIVKEPSLFQKYRLPKVIGDFVVRKANQICEEWTKAIRNGEYA